METDLVGVLGEGVKLLDQVRKEGAAGDLLAPLEWMPALLEELTWRLIGTLRAKAVVGHGVDAATAFGGSGPTTTEAALYRQFLKRPAALSEIARESWRQQRVVEVGKRTDQAFGLLGKGLSGVLPSIRSDAALSGAVSGLLSTVASRGSEIQGRLGEASKEGGETAAVGILLGFVQTAQAVVETRMKALSAGPKGAVPSGPELLEIQQQMAALQRMTTSVTELLKSMHDAKMGVLRNLR